MGFPQQSLNVLACTSFSFELSFDNIEWQNPEPRNSYDRRSESSGTGQSGHSSYQPKDNINSRVHTNK
ncbi:hypothetical protein PO909_001496 [Leuciscus waleckii]